MTAIRRMKTPTALVMGLAVILLAGGTVQADDTTTIRGAYQAALETIEVELAKANLQEVKSVALVPVVDDPDGYVGERLRAMLVNRGLTVVTRNEQEWNTLLGEVEFGDRRGDTMDQATVKHLGSVLGADAIVFARIWDVKTNMWSIRASTEVSASITKVETGQVVWSVEQIPGEAYMHWSDAVTQFYRFPLLILGAIVVLIVVLYILAKLFKALGHATRPL